MVCIQVFKTGGFDSYRLVSSLGERTRMAPLQSCHSSVLLTGCQDLHKGFYYADSNALPVGSALNDNLEEIPVA